jgi:hypothetical protein
MACDNLPCRFAKPNGLAHAPAGYRRPCEVQVGGTGDWLKRLSRSPCTRRVSPWDMNRRDSLSIIAPFLTPGLSRRVELVETLSKPIAPACDRSRRTPQGCRAAACPFVWGLAGASVWQFSSSINEPSAMARPCESQCVHRHNPEDLQNGDTRNELRIMYFPTNRLFRL